MQIRLGDPVVRRCGAAWSGRLASEGTEGHTHQDPPRERILQHVDTPSGHGSDPHSPQYGLLDNGSFVDGAPSQLVGAFENSTTT